MIRKVRITKGPHGWFCLLPSSDRTGAPYDAVLCETWGEAIGFMDIFIAARQRAMVSQPLRIQ